MNASAIFLAAGEGKRFGGDVRKPFVAVGRRPLFLVTLERFSKIAGIRERILVVRAEDVRAVRERYGEDLARVGVREVVAGGARRQGSVRAGLRACSAGSDLVLVHDAVRPLVGHDVVLAALREAEAHGAAIVAVPVRDTLKRADASGVVEATVPRAMLWRAQTPQVFAREILERALAEVDRRGLEVTDDSEMVEALGIRPRIVPGSEACLKVTDAGDVELLEALLAIEQRRSGGA
jgi:2-C-methyl-D-erythritol 4-phosphate cytidylyltransferase